MFDSLLDCTMKKHASICGNAPLSIILSSVCGHQYGDHQRARISFEWDLDFAIPAKPNSKQPFKVKHVERFSLNDAPRNGSLEDNRMCCANDSAMFNDRKVIRPPREQQINEVQTLKMPIP